MTDTPPLLTDRAALEAHRARAARGGVADFLWRAVSDEIDERLLEVNRGFNSVAVVSPQPDMWRDLRAAGPHPQARFVADTDVLDLPQQGHDLVLHLMALHWANDPVGQIDIDWFAAVVPFDDGSLKQRARSTLPAPKVSGDVYTPAGNKIVILSRTQKYDSRKMV